MLRTILIALVAATTSVAEDATQPAVVDDFSVVNSNGRLLRRSRELGNEQKIRGAGLGIKGKKTKQLDDNYDDDNDDEKKKQMKMIQSENDDRKGVNDKLRDRDAGDRMKDMKMKKYVEDWVDDADEDEDEGKRKKKTKNNNDDDDEKDKQKQMNMLKQELMDEKRQNKDRQRNRDKQANKDKQNKKSKLAKRGKRGKKGNANMEPLSGVVDDTDETETNQRPLNLYPPWKDKDALLSALDYLNIDPQKWENMSKEERNDVIQMMDGELSIDFTSPITATSDKPKDNKGDKTVDIRDVDWSMVEHSAAGGGTIYEDGGDIIYDPEEEPFEKSSKWNFVSASSSCHDDTTVQLESFEDNDNIIPSLHGVTAMKWTTPLIDPWSPSKDYASEGMWSTMSGLTPSVLKDAATTTTPTYSNMTLIIEENFDGGVMTFKVLGPGLGLPYEALFVMVDDRIEVNIGDSTTAADGNNADGWVEYSVPVEYGTHEVKWVHVYNPFGLLLSSLPPQEEKRRKRDGIGLFIDDVRFAKFTKSNDKSKIDIINGHCDSSSIAGTTTSLPWQVIDEGQTIIASTSDITNHADIQFVIFSAKGGMLTYSLHTSTTAPMDDFAILLNSGGNVDKTVEAIFGNMPGYEVKSLSVPKGKVTITLRHRKDPGMLGEALLGTLGSVSTDGRSSLRDLRFEVGWQ